MVHCDGTPDTTLFGYLQRISPALATIPSDNIRTYPQQDAARTDRLYDHLLPLFECDRPDFIITLDAKPVLVVEITEHAYTGDNGLQRFVRVAAAAEQRVPFIYFGPLARTRDDEMDRLDDDEDGSTLSKRSLTSDFFEGMRSLHQKFGSPQLYVEWQTALNGKVRKLSSRPGERDIEEVYGNLVRLMEAVLLDAISQGRDAQARSQIRYNQAEVTRLAAKKNTLASDVKFAFSAQETAVLLSSPAGLIHHLEGYFAKGKPDKLIAFHALKSLRVAAVRIGRRVEATPATVKKVVNAIVADPMFHHGSIGFYTGYKWRSDPHSGVAANVYYRVCESGTARAKPLIIFYPRVSVLSQSTERLLQSVSFDSALGRLFTDRYGTAGSSKFRKTTSSPHLYSTWDTTAKQARIFTKYAALIVCSDGFVLGERLAHVFDDA